MSTRHTSLLPVGLFTGAYLAIASFFALNQGNREFVFYIGVVLLLGLMVMAVHCRVRLSPGVLWALSLWGLLHMMGGLVEVPESWPVDARNVLYSWWIIPHYLKYDHVIHAYGFAVATWACWQSLRNIAPKVQPTVGPLALCVFGGMGLGAANEIVEFVATLMIAGTNVGGYTNTGWDLVANFAGSVTAATVIGMRR